MRQLHLKREPGRSLYQQIYAELRNQIFRGDIAAGELLPSYRFLSRKYQVNISTVEKAYDLLEANGYIERRHGSGCFALPLDKFEFYADGVVLDSFESGQSKRPDVIDFATSTPLPGAAETAALLSTLNELSAKNPETLFRYPPTRGAPALLRAIHQRLLEKGMDVREENLQIISGSQQGIDLICKALISKNTSVLVDDPSYSMAVNCFRRAGARIITVPMEGDGPDLAAMREILARDIVDYYYTMPSFQCPTNVTWSAEKRGELLELAYRYGFMVIEDDCLGELYFDGIPRPSLRQEDRNGSVLYLNSFSKCLVPGMRLGYMAVPGRYEKKLILAKFSTDIACPAILQETLAAYMQSGAYEEHLRGLRTAYAQKRRHLARAIEQSQELALPYAENGGGVFFWVRLPEEVDSTDLWSSLRNQNIKLLPSAVFSSTGRFKNYVRMSYVGCPMEQMEPGIARIDREIQRLRARR